MVERKRSDDGMTDEQYLAPVTRQLRVVGVLLVAAALALLVALVLL